MYVFWGAQHFCFYGLTPSDPSKGVKMGIFKVSLYYYKNAFQPWFNVKTSKTDLENRQNTHFYPFRGVWGGQPIKAKVSGTSKYIIIILFNAALAFRQAAF